MNDIIQNILVFIAIGSALLFLLKKFFWKKPALKKGCGSGNGCGCH